MPKDVPFYQLCKKVKKRKLNTENVEKSNSTDSSTDFNQLHIQQSQSNDYRIPDFHFLEEELELSPYFQSSHYSDSSHHSEHSDQSENFQYFDQSENSNESLLLPYSPSLSSSQSSENYNFENSRILQFLRGWALKHNITHDAVSDLLKGLKKNHECFADESEFKFPINARTLLKTKVKLSIKVVKPGHYIHIGLKKQLLKLAPKYLKTVASFKILINIDGLPLFKSSSGEVYPILCTIVSISELRNKVFPIGIYYGKEKPENLEDYLEDFIAEINSLKNNGLHYENCTARLDGVYFVCDAPAKSFIMGTVSHTGFYSCTRCTVRGVTSNNRRIFLDLESSARTCEDFLQWKDSKFRRRNTPLTNIADLDFVHHFVLDYLHLECLGVMRSMIVKMWYQGEILHRLSAAQIELMSNDLVRFQKFIPVEFARKPREIYIVLRWKATEFRLFLLYVGPIVLTNILSEQKYTHFLEFHCAMRILLNPILCKEQKFRQYAKALLKHFVESTAILYDKNFIGHNFHNNIHIVDDADYFVDKLDNFSLDTVSAFPFENYMQNIKRIVRKRSKPLEQIGRRIGEIMSLDSNCSADKNDKFPKFFYSHNTGPTLPDCTRQQYRGVALEQFKIINQSPNNCCDTISKKIIQVENISFCRRLQIPIVIGREFINKCDFYNIPFESSRVGIFKVNKLSNLKKWPLSDIVTKYI